MVSLSQVDWCKTHHAIIEPDMVTIRTTLESRRTRKFFRTRQQGRPKPKRGTRQKSFLLSQEQELGQARVLALELGQARALALELEQATVLELGWAEERE